MHLTKIFLFAITIIISTSCNAQVTKSANPQNTSDVLTKYSVTFGTPRVDSEYIKQNTCVPYLKEGKYYLSKYTGEIIVNKPFDKIIIGLKVPFSICRIDEVDFIYNMSGELATEKTFKNLSINSFRRSNSKGVIDILVQKGDTTHLEITNINAHQEDIHRFQEELLRITDGHDKKVRDLNYLFENGIEDPTTGLKISKSNLRVYSNQYGNWVSVRNDNIHGLLDTDGNWIYPLEERRMRLYDISLPFNGGTLEITDGAFKFVINQDYKIIEQGKGKELLNVTDLNINEIPAEYLIEKPQYQICPNIEEYIQLRDSNWNSKWTHFFNFEGKYLKSFRGSTMEGFRYPANSDVRKFITNINNNQVEYYARISDGFIYSNEKIE